MLADLVSLYFVAVTVGGAALAAFIALAPMLDSTEVFPGEQVVDEYNNQRYRTEQHEKGRKKWNRTFRNQNVETFSEVDYSLSSPMRRDAYIPGRSETTINPEKTGYLQ